MPTISFPGSDDSQGFTCEIYSYGWTSGCTDENGVNRGFTQEWYYDGGIGAWISVTEGVTGGGADFTNAGPTYTSELHVAPVVTGSGNIRKFAYLDPDTGSLTFDYINTYDLLNPTEREYNVADFSWAALQYYDHNQTGTWRLDAGYTLCSDGDHTYEIWSGSDNRTGYQWYVNRTSTTTVSPFSPGPPSGATGFILSATPLANVVSIDGDPSSALPLAVGESAEASYYTGVSGEIKIPISEVKTGFTADGPSTNAFQVKLLFHDLDDFSDGNSIIGGQKVKLDNWVYVFASTVPSGITENGLLDYINGVSGSSGTKKLLNPNDAQSGTNPLSDHFFTNKSNSSDPQGLENGKYFTFEEMGSPGSGTYIYVLIPTRCEVIAEEHLFKDPSAPSAAGFPDSGTDGSGYAVHYVTGITNEFNYYETYDVFRSLDANGAPESGIMIKKLTRTT